MGRAVEYLLNCGCVAHCSVLYITPLANTHIFTYIIQLPYNYGYKTKSYVLHCNNCDSDHMSNTTD